MSILMLGILVIGFFCMGYRIYGGRVEKVFGVDPDRKTPALEQYDGVDYVPARHWFVLFGHHFASIAGLGPIVGPAIAIIWGWLPAILWIFFGAIILGAVHDLGALIVSMRGKGRSIGDLAANIINGRTRVLFLLIIFFEQRSWGIGHVIKVCDARNRRA